MICFNEFIGFDTYKKVRYLNLLVFLVFHLKYMATATPQSLNIIFLNSDFDKHLRNVFIRVIENRTFIFSSKRKT